MDRRVFIPTLLLIASSTVSACGGLNNDIDTNESQPFQLKLVNAPSALFAGECEGDRMSIQVVQKTNGTSIVVNEDLVITARGFSNDSEIDQSVFLQPTSDCDQTSTTATIEDGDAEKLVYLQVTRVEVTRVELSVSNGTVAGTEVSVQVSPNFLGGIELDNLPTSNTAGSAFSPNPTVQLTDAWGNWVSEITSVSLAAYLDSTCTSLASGGPLSGNSGATSSTGALTFPNLRYSTPSTLYLKASVTGFDSISSLCKGPVTVVTL